MRHKVLDIVRHFDLTMITGFFVYIALETNHLAVIIFAIIIWGLVFGMQLYLYHKVRDMHALDAAYRARMQQQDRE